MNSSASSFTPHARGSTLFPFSGNVQDSVYPACAGIDRAIGPRRHHYNGLPRMRGDRPSLGAEKILPLTFTPHARGSTFTLEGRIYHPNVYPACAGIDLTYQDVQRIFGGLPRMRGDRPRLSEIRAQMEEFTPHARGSTVYCSIPLLLPYVYPACAGIDRGKLGTAIHLPGLPRMRGDRPKPRGKYWTHVRFTPHARGSTLSRI